MNAERKQRKDKLELKILHLTFHEDPMWRTQQQTEDRLLLRPED